MTMSRLPPRMEMHEREKKSQQLLNRQQGSYGQQNVEEGNEFRYKAKEVPNFELQQKLFQQKLDQSKQNQRLT